MNPDDFLDWLQSSFKDSGYRVIFDDSSRTYQISGDALEEQLALVFVPPQVVAISSPVIGERTFRIGRLADYDAVLVPFLYQCLDGEIRL